MVKYGNRAINVQQLEGSTSAHRLTPLQFDSEPSGNVTTELSASVTKNIAFNSRARFVC